MTRSKLITQMKRKESQREAKARGRGCGVHEEEREPCTFMKNLGTHEKMTLKRGKK
jgi:hypothetical protein